MKKGKVKASRKAPAKSKDELLEDLIRAGSMLSSIAFNVKQLDTLPVHYKDSFGAYQASWDKALSAYRAVAPQRGRAKG